jgi:hypothetical protein
VIDWRSLSNDELRARLVQRGMSKWEADYCVARREEWSVTDYLDRLR